MSAPRTDRRDLLKKAAVGGAVVWTAPVVLSAASAAASADPGCSLVVSSVATQCGTPNYNVDTTVDTSACPGSTVQLDAINGSPLSSWCDPIESWGVSTSGGGPFIITYTISLRDACDGTVLAGPQDFIIDAVALCQGPGDEPGAPVDPGDSSGTVTVTLGDRSIEVTAGG